MTIASSLDTLRRFVENRPLADYSCHSRVHRLNGFQGDFYVKRDDELSFGVAGSKLRKYLSLVPALKAKGYTEAVLIGGASSNNIVGLSQLLIEEGIQPILFLCGRRPDVPSGNLLISQSLVNRQYIHWHDKQAWPCIDQLAEEYAANREACCVIPEGASSADALPGALTLAMDIVENERKLGISFDHILCDAGTGMMASALVLGNSILGREVEHHVLLLADDEEAFHTALARWKDELGKLIEKPLAPIKLYRPSNAQSFGSINAGVRKEIARIAREEGILTDPVYTAKLFSEARRMDLSGNVLLIHSGSGLGSMFY